MFSPPYDKLSRFAGNLATCLEAGVDVDKSFENASRSLKQTRLAGGLIVAQSRIAKGASLAEALAACEWGLPPFFVPMIHAGEQTGRVDESLRYLERHCKLLVEPTKAVRNAWMIPLAVALGGTAIQFFAYLFFGSWTATLSFAFASFFSYAKFGLLAFVVLSSPAKPLFDELKMWIPFVRDVERETAVNRFFHAFAMLYAAAGQRVENMISFSARTVTNTTMRKDLLAIGSRIEQGAAVPEAFAKAKHLLQEEKDIVESGDLSGTLEKSFERISYDTAEKLSFRLGIFQKVFTRIMTYVVFLSVIYTLLGLLRAGLLN